MKFTYRKCPIDFISDGIINLLVNINRHFTLTLPDIMSHNVCKTTPKILMPFKFENIIVIQTHFVCDKRQYTIKLHVSIIVSI